MVITEAAEGAYTVLDGTGSIIVGAAPRPPGASSLASPLLQGRRGCRHCARCNKKWKKGAINEQERKQKQAQEQERNMLNEE
mmetsp:Transcript_31677/g.67487  ORF Transcript_31677/g.67487 Transcript_31677/m.67487 type:complete len:82 (+) Transcript_31677:401-646(+)